MVVDSTLLLLLVLPWLQNGRTWQVAALDWLLAAFALGYKPFAEWVAGATIGKAFLRFRVCSDDLTKLTPGSALLRNLPYLTVMALLIAQLGVLAGDPASGLHVRDQGAWIGEDATRMIRAMTEGPGPLFRVLQIAGSVAIVLSGVLLGRARLDPYRQAIYDRMAGTLCVTT